MRRPAVVLTATLGLLAVPVAAAAHPAFNPSEIPAGVAVESVLVVPHGCAPGGGMPDGDAQPTTELALQVTDGVRVDAHEVAGWDVAEDGEALTWTDAGGATTDVIQFPVTLTVDEEAQPGDEIRIRAYQECADGSAFQWVGTPDDEATWPAVFLAVSDGAIGTAEPDEAGGAMDHGEMDMGADDEMDMGDDDESDMGDDGDMAGGDAEGDDMAMQDAAAEDVGGVSTAVLVLLAAVVVAVLVGAFVLGRRRTG